VAYFFGPPFRLFRRSKGATKFPRERDRRLTDRPDHQPSSSALYSDTAIRRSRMNYAFVIGTFSVMTTRGVRP